jgi:hypothetical protein
VADEQNNKATRIKDLAFQAENFTKENLEQVKELQAKAVGGSVSGIQLMQRDLKLIQRHKQLVKEFVYAEMREHGKLLEMYSRLFEETQMRVNVSKEFVHIMSIEGKFKESEIEEFVKTKLKGMAAAEAGAQFRGAAAGGPRSQSANRPAGVPQRM